MKNWLMMCALTMLALAPGSAFAFRAEHFKGMYEVVTEKSARGEEPDKKLFFVDNDTVGNIWARWAEGDLPADLERYRNEPAVLAGFTFRNTLFFTLEQSVLVGPIFMQVPGSDGKTLEIRARPDGHYDLGVQDGGVSIYELGPRQPLPF